jgi:hypothetical protein
MLLFAFLLVLVTLRSPIQSITITNDMEDTTKVALHWSSRATSQCVIILDVRRRKRKVL